MTHLSQFFFDRMNRFEKMVLRQARCTGTILGLRGIGNVSAETSRGGEPIRRRDLETHGTNPAVTIARSLSDTFAGIAPADLRRSPECSPRSALPGGFGAKRRSPTGQSSLRLLIDLEKWIRNKGALQKNQPAPGKGAGWGLRGAPARGMRPAQSQAKTRTMTVARRDKLDSIH
jgi:hypothetical protein